MSEPQVKVFPGVLLNQQWLAMNGKSMNLELLSPQGWVSQLVFSMHQNPEVSSNAGEGMDLLGR